MNRTLFLDAPVGKSQWWTVAKVAKGTARIAVEAFWAVVLVGYMLWMLVAVFFGTGKGRK